MPATNSGHRPYAVHEGAAHDFVIEPMVCCRRRDGSLMSKVWRIRRRGEGQRARFWMVSREHRMKGWAHHVASFPTLTEARQKAQQLAAEDRTLALLKGA